MKAIILVSLFLVGTGFVQGRPKVGQRADLIDETNLPDGLYHIQTAHDSNLQLGALVNGDGNIETWMGNVTVEGHDPNGTIPNELVWRAYKDDCQCFEGAVYLTRQLLTYGPNGYNNFNFELPAGNGSFPVQRFWRLRNLGEDVVAINNVPFFNFGVDDDTCAQNNGEREALTFVPCDANDLRQQFRFVSAEESQ